MTQAGGDQSWKNPFVYYIVKCTRLLLLDSSVLKPFFFFFIPPTDTFSDVEKEAEEQGLNLKGN